MYELRPYQKEASDRAIEFFLDKKDKSNAIIVAACGAGKSLIISDIAYRLNSDVLVFCLSKELVEQDYAKMKTYTDDCAMYCASTGHKEIARVTFASIASAKNAMEDFKHFRYVLVDECQAINSEEGMYIDFLEMLGVKVLGLTATPYRLSSERYFDYELKRMSTRNSKLTMLTNESNSFFSKIIYKIETKDLQDMGYLANPVYVDARPKRWNNKMLKSNTSGAEFSNSSVKFAMETSGHLTHLVDITQRLLHAKDGIRRKGVLVFAMFVEDAMAASNELNQREGSMVSAFLCGETTKKNRERILQEFRDGTIRVLFNVGVLVTGYDYPALDTIVLGRPTMSLTIYYQSVGRCLRLAENKQRPWVIDTVGNNARFGNVDNLRIFESSEKKQEVFGWVDNQWKQLTGVILDKKK